MITLALDPGEHRTAGALFDGVELVGLEWLTPGVFWPGSHLIDRVVVEKPRLYPGHPRPGNILNLAWGGALVVGSLRAPVTELEPSAWKGAVKKPQHHARIWGRLSLAERFKFPDPDKIEDKIAKACAKLAKTGKVLGYSFEAHNLLDACALGMFFLERSPKGG